MFNKLWLEVDKYLEKERNLNGSGFAIGIRLGDSNGLTLTMI